ncbi:MAG: DUF1549 domain-containing protein [Planctomycetaceae bacterium]
MKRTKISLSGSVSGSWRVAQVLRGLWPAGLSLLAACGMAALCTGRMPGVAGIVIGTSLVFLSLLLEVAAFLNNRRHQSVCRSRRVVRRQGHQFYVYEASTETDEEQQSNESDRTVSQGETRETGMTRFSKRLTQCAVTMVMISSVVQADDQSAKQEYFEKKVRPVLAGHCYNCHSADNKAAGGLRVDDRNGIVAGGGRGPAIVEGQPNESLLIRAVSHADPKLQMPPDSKISDEEIDVLKQWIADGAWWPGPEAPDDLGTMSDHYAELRKSHWAWQPLTSPAVPAVKNTDWARDDIDRFVLAKLEEAGLPPVGDAGREALLRRVTFDLTGLPPSAEDVQNFLADESPSAYETVVERLLASPAFGEHWGRHWLDLARYGESTGSARNLPYPQAWKYRDYVIQSFNRDKPYDQFLREQIAGDLLPHETPEQRKEHLIATGFLALGVKDVNQRFKVRFVMDNIDEQIDTVTKSVLGLSVSCARCHDHKFDPIPASEYYALVGIFHSTDLCAGLRNKMGGGGLEYYDTSLLLMLSENKELSEEQKTKIAQAKQKADEAKAEFERIRDSADAEKPGPNGRPMRQIARQKWNRAQAEYVALTDPAATAETALGARDSGSPGDTEIRYRGEAEQLGPKVPRGFLSVVQGPQHPTIPEGTSGRLQLAQWLTDPANPLTSRVLANRVWYHLFGTGIVSTTDNFGVTGERPSHPELLDHLAGRLIHNGWSVKSLVRSIVLSRSYRLSGDTTAEHLLKDPQNRLVWRHSPRRLTAEEIRDAQLVGSGRLNSTPENGSVAAALRVIELRNNGPEAKGILDYAAKSERRSVYLPLLRTLVPKSLEVFDFAEQGLVTGNRETTTVPAQSLYLLNDTFVRKQSLYLAEQISGSSASDEERVRQVYLRLLGRAPTPAETERSVAFVSRFSSEAGALLAEHFAAASGASAATAPDAASVAAAEPPKEGTPDPQLAASQAQAAQLANPDDVAQEEEVAPEEQIIASNPQAAAWHSLVQAVMGSAEFLYVR